MNLEILEIASAFSKPRNDKNSRIPYRDPRIKPEDDTRTPGDDSYLRNSRIPSLFLDLSFLSIRRKLGAIQKEYRRPLKAYLDL